jgi:aryl-alcohol dehydrogenase-like predicted oxidoreductase
MRLALGTVQFGLDYGVSNTSGRTPFEEVLSILDFATASGVETLDTAPANGAEVVLARAGARERGFRIITKTTSLSAGLEAVVARAHASVDRLGRPLDTIMVHSAADLMLADGERLWHALHRLQDEGAVERLGVSFYARDPIIEIVERFGPQVAQLPTSILNQRLIRNGTIAELAPRDVEVYARSAFHQGLIFANLDGLPPRLREKRGEIETVQNKLAEDGRSPLHLAPSFLATVTVIHSILISVTRRAELEEIVAASRTPWPNIDASSFATDDPIILDPRSWGKT